MPPRRQTKKETDLERKAREAREMVRKRLLETGKLVRKPGLPPRAVTPNQFTKPIVRKPISVDEAVSVGGRDPRVEGSYLMGRGPMGRPQPVVAPVRPVASGRSPWEAVSDPAGTFKDIGAILARNFGGVFAEPSAVPESGPDVPRGMAPVETPEEQAARLAASRITSGVRPGSLPPTAIAFDQVNPRTAAAPTPVPRPTPTPTPAPSPVAVPPRGMAPVETPEEQAARLAILRRTSGVRPNVTLPPGVGPIDQVRPPQPAVRPTPIRGTDIVRKPVAAPPPKSPGEMSYQELYSTAEGMGIQLDPRARRSRLPDAAPMQDIEAFRQALTEMYAAQAAPAAMPTSPASPDNRGVTRVGMGIPSRLRGPDTTAARPVVAGAVTGGAVGAAAGPVSRPWSGDRGGAAPGLGIDRTADSAEGLVIDPNKRPAQPMSDLTNRLFGGTGLPMQMPVQQPLQAKNNILTNVDISMLRGDTSRRPIEPPEQNVPMWRKILQVAFNTIPDALIHYTAAKYDRPDIAENWLQQRALKIKAAQDAADLDVEREKNVLDQRWKAAQLEQAREGSRRAIAKDMADLHARAAKGELKDLNSFFAGADFYSTVYEGYGGDKEDLLAGFPFPRADRIDALRVEYNQYLKDNKDNIEEALKAAAFQDPLSDDPNKRITGHQVAEALGRIDPDTGRVVTYTPDTTKVGYLGPDGRPKEQVFETRKIIGREFNAVPPAPPQQTWARVDTQGPGGSGAISFINPEGVTKGPYPTITTPTDFTAKLAAIKAMSADKRRDAIIVSLMQEDRAKEFGPDPSWIPDAAEKAIFDSKAANKLRIARRAVEVAASK